MKKIINSFNVAGEEMSLWAAATISHSPALPLFLRSYAEVAEQGFTEPMFVFNNSNHVIWIENAAKKVVAGIVYEYRQKQRSGFIVLSFTDPDHRGKGLNKICHNIVVKHIKRLGGLTITSSININNTSMLSAASKVGMTAVSYKMSKNI